MRTDTAAFAAKNAELAKRPRYVIELAFDPANTVLWYLTSHTDSALPPGAQSILGVIEGMSGTSQTLNPDTANASIGNINFSVVDRGSIVTTTLGSQLTLGRSTRRQRVRVYVGYEGLAWADYTLVQTQLVTEIAYNEGAYKFTCADIQREMRKDIFELAKTTLAQSLSAGATTIEVFSTAALQMVAHGPSYSDAPNATVGYVKIQDEVIRWTSKTPTQLILGAGGMRGALNTRPVEHAVDAATSADRRTAVEEYVYLEMPAVKLMYGLLTGLMENKGTLAFDFARTQSLAPTTGSATLTVTRAGGAGAAATRVNSAGLIETVAADTPRFDYDSVTLECKGLLIEEARPNSALWSQDFTNAWWVKNSQLAPIANAATAPDGTVTATRLIEDTTVNGNHYLQSTGLAITAGQVVAASWFVKANGRTSPRFFVADASSANGAYVDVDLAAGTISAGVSIGTGTLVSRKLTSLPNGWYRVELAASLGGALTTAYSLMGLYIGGAPYTGNGVSGYFVWGGQIELNASFATSYIPTTNAAVTRNADVALVPALGAWFNASEGTIVAEADCLNVGAATRAGVAFDNNTAAEEILVGEYNGVGITYIVRGGVGQANINPAGAIAANAAFRLASAYKVNDVAAAANGGAVSTVISALMPTPDRVRLGHRSGATDFLNGHLRRFTYYPTRRTNAELQTLSAGGAIYDVPLPTAWNLGIPTGYVRRADFTGIGSDLWNTATDAGFPVRFEGLTKTDGKKFIESELALLSGVFMPVYADGALGLKRMSNILAGAAYSNLLDYSNLVSVGDLVHDFNALHNVLQISWNWEPAQKDFTRVNLLIDAASIATHGRSEPLKLKFRGLHGSIHSSTILAQRFDALRDRYSGPPQRTDVKVLHRLNGIEVGDVERLKPAGVRDFVTPGGGALDRSFEVQNISIDWITGNVGLKLFASSQAPGAIPATADATVLSDAWYSSQGSALSTVLTITGSNPGHVTATGTLTGTADLTAAGSTFYYPGDLVIDPGVTINVVNNVQLRVKGFFQNNGAINGVGAGIAGAAATVVPASASDSNPGVAGGVGVTEAGGGLANSAGPGPFQIVQSIRGNLVIGQYPTLPAFSLKWDGVSLLGLPLDLRGTSGSSGQPIFLLPPSSLLKPGGAGGNSGAGLAVISRGFSQGVAGKIDLSGTDGLPGGFGIPGTNVTTYHAGSGAGGAPGGLLIVLDGAGLSATGLTESGFVALQGKTPITGVPVNSFAGGNDLYSNFVGTGDGTTFPLPSLSGARGGNRVQYVPGNLAATPDLSAITLAAPTNLGLASGTAELLVQGDGTIVPRIRATWTPSLDSRTLAYELQFKPSSATLWSSAPLISGQSVSAAYITGIADGINYDVQVRAVGAARAESNWLTFTNYFVIGKTALPTDVSLFTIEGTVLTWAPVPDADVIGYRLKYQPGTSRSWGDAIPMHNGELTSSPYDMLVTPSGPVTIMVKAVDSSTIANPGGNESKNAAYIVTDLGGPLVANVVETFDRKAAGFPGTKTACSVSGGNLVADPITPLMWKADPTVAMWSADSSALMWATVQYAAMTYVDTVLLSRALLGSRMTIQYTIQGDPWSIAYRENSPVPAWNLNDTTLAWSVDDTKLAWDQPAYLPWPGEIIVKNSVYDFRITTGQANTQGVVSALTITVDAPNISESLDNIVISAGGTRLPITKNFTAIKNVQLTVQADGGTAISARTDDKVTTLGAGPLVHGIDAAGANTSALVDAHIQGY